MPCDQAGLRTDGPPAVRTSAALAPEPNTLLTDVELTWIEGRYEQWIRFGRVAGERIVNRRTRVQSFREGAVFALVRWSSNDFGTVFSTAAILAACAPGRPCSTLPFVRPGAEILLRLDGWPRVRRVLDAIDAVEAAGIEACDAAPDHWLHVASRLAAGSTFRPYTAERHAAWLRRRKLEG